MNAKEVAQMQELGSLLLRCVHLLEYATYHDGRYSQMESAGWQDEAIEVSKAVNEKLGRERYADIGAPK